MWSICVTRNASLIGLLISQTGANRDIADSGWLHKLQISPTADVLVCQLCDVSNSPLAYIGLAQAVGNKSQAKSCG